MGDVHDGVNFMRAACVIAVEKAKASFEPMLEVQYTHIQTHTERESYIIVRNSRSAVTSVFSVLHYFILLCLTCQHK